MTDTQVRNDSEWRKAIRDEIDSVTPGDQREIDDQSKILSWIDSGAELCRRRKPDIPPVHLVSYFLLVDGSHFLLVDHISSGLWLPTGGHVEPGEHPRDTVSREAMEELGVTAELLHSYPLFLSMTETVGSTAGHLDVSIWYALSGNRHAPLKP